jgi:hypothetical protein
MISTKLNLNKATYFIIKGLQPLLVQLGLFLDLLLRRLIELADVEVGIGRPLIGATTLNRMARSLTTPSALLKKIILVYAVSLFSHYPECYYAKRRGANDYHYPAPLSPNAS